MVEAERAGAQEPEPLAAPPRRSPFLVGLLGAAGVAVTYAGVRFVYGARAVLTLIGIAVFLAVGLDPVVRWLQRRGLPRWAAVAAVAVGTVAVLAGILAAAIPPLVGQATKLIHELPAATNGSGGHSSTLGRLAVRLHLQNRLHRGLSSIRAGAVFGGVLGAGRIAVSASASLVAIVVLTIYLLGDLPRITRAFYRLIPASRRARATQVGDQVFTRVGGYLLGNLLTSLIAGVGTLVWLLIFHVPYPLLLAVAVAILDLIPIVGSTIGGIIVTLVALTVSLPVAIATAAFYTVYRLAEDYLLVPRIIGRTVKVPAITTLIAVLIGGGVLGIIGAFIAIPVAATIDVLLREFAYPRLDAK
jgi:predicted PurR-regulated permease PerM